MSIYLEHQGFVKNEAYDDYRLLVEKAIQRVHPSSSRKTAKRILGYCESHHIIPSCLGGSDDQSNKVWLTAFEHLKAHLLLVKFSADEATKHKTSHAAIRMLNKQHHRHERVYEEDLPDQMLIEIAQMREVAATLHAKHMSVKHSGEGNPFFGRTNSEESNEARRKAMTGFQRTQKNKDACRESKKGDKNPARKQVVCPFCGTEGMSGGMRKHHFDYCIEDLRFHLLHESGDVFVGTREEFTRHTSTAKWLHGEIGALLRQRKPTFRGWRLVSRITSNTEPLEKG